MLFRSRGAKLAEDEYQIIKSIFHDTPKLEFIPKTLWIPVCQKLDLVEVNKGKKLLSKDEINPQCFVILTGQFRIENYKEFDQNEEKLLTPGKTCGNFEYFIGKPWIPMDVIGIEDISTAATFNPREVERLLEIDNKNIQYKALSSFLAASISGFEQLSSHSKERLCSFFKEVIFLPNKEIIKEGSVPTYAYLIKEGECTIFSSQNPLLFDPNKRLNTPHPPEHIAPINYSAQRAVNSTLSPARTLRGNMSLSTNLCQLRTVGEHEWLGEEVLIADDGPGYRFEYSVVATTRLVALEIAKENIKRFPVDLMDWFRKNARNKINWHNTRKTELANTVRKIYKMDPMNSFLDEALSQIVKRFPQASCSHININPCSHFVLNFQIDRKSVV